MIEAPPSEQARTLLRAGAFLPSTWSTPEDEPVASVSARAYTHAALGDRVIVRLVQDELEAAEDASLAPLGFKLRAAQREVARARPRTLGFIAWVVMNRPALAQRLADEFKEFEQLGRLAQSKPGAARTGYEQLAAHLAAVDPALLPPLYEDAARHFVEAGNPAQASALFGKARAAERSFSLEVDPKQRDSRFLEFAIAGALSGGVLEDYADELRRTESPADAYATFHSLCIERTRAGMPPWAGMGTHLQALAAAAGRDREAAATQLLRDLLPCATLAQASAGFWRTYRRQLIDMARESSAVRGRLLNLMPAPTRDTGDFSDWWLQFLDACGATRSLIELEPGEAADAQPLGGPAQWLVTYLSTTVRRRLTTITPTSPALLDLLDRMAERLRNDGVPLDLFGANVWSADLDVVDHALALGLVVRPPRDRRLMLHTWLRKPTRGPLTHIAADPTLGPLLGKAVDDFLRGGQVDALAASAPGLVDRWLTRTCERLATGCLVDVGHALNSLSKTTSPRAAERVRSADIAKALQRTLSGGLIDEFGWPALEQARGTLTTGKAPPHMGIQVAPAWPNLVISDGSRAIVVGPEQILFEHDLRPPTGQGHLPNPGFIYADGQLLCCWRTTGGLRAYWSNRPLEYFDPVSAPPGMGYAYYPLAGASVELPGGGRTAGGRVVHAGDSRLSPSHHMLTDGSRFWRVRAPGPRIEEYDPLTGRTVGHAPPPFLSIDDNALELVREASALLPIPESVASTSPLGSRDGLTGWCLQRNVTSGKLRGESLDGRVLETADASEITGVTPLGLLAWPGDDRPRILAASHNSVVVLDPSGTNRLLEVNVAAHRTNLSNGTPLVPPPLFWHCLRPRDTEGSRALRRVSLETAQMLLRTAADEASPENKFPRTLETIKRLLPEITNSRLQAGVLGAAAYAASLEQRRASLEVAQQEPWVGPAQDAPRVSDEDLQSALSGMTSQSNSTYFAMQRGHRVNSLEHLRLVSGYFESVLSAGSASPPTELPNCAVPWELFIGAMGAIAYLAASPFVSEVQREALLAFLEIWKDSVFATRPDRFRLYGMYDTQSPTPRPLIEMEVEDGHHYLVRRGRIGRESTQHSHVLEATLSDFKPPARFTPSWSRAWTESVGRGQIEALIERVRRDGPFTWRPEAAEQVAERTGLTRAEAALLMAGLPNVNARQHHFLGTDLRALLQLKMAEANAARAVLQRLSAHQRIELLAACLPPEPTELWDSLERSVYGVSAAWSTRFGRRVELSDQLVLAAHAELSGLTPLSPQEALMAIAQPDQEPRLNNDAEWRLDARGTLTPNAQSPQFFDRAALDVISRLVAWLYLNVPVGDPIRAGIPRALELVRERLSNPQLLLGGKWVPRTIQGTDILETLQGSSFMGTGGMPLPASKDIGWAVILAPHPNLQLVHTFVRPSRVSGAESPELVTLLGLAQIMSVVRFITGPGGKALQDRVNETPVPTGQFEANPLLSAPEVIADLAASLSIEAHSAALYLQVLALAEPSIKNCLHWTGWSPSDYKRAVEELLAAELVVTGTRPRASRSIFLPGPWVQAKAPNLPIEQWKLPLYEGGVGLAGRYLPTRPVHELFAAAWQRIMDGDRP